MEWSPDGSHLAFVSTSRDHKHEQFRIADATTGDVRNVFEESVATDYESGIGQIDWRYLPASNEVIWYSARDNWGQLYLYDLRDGATQESDHERATVTSPRRSTSMRPSGEVYFLAVWP